MLDYLFKRRGGNVESAVERASLGACSEADKASPHSLLPPHPCFLTNLMVFLLVSAAVCGGVLTYELGAHTHTALPVDCDISTLLADSLALRHRQGIRLSCAPSTSASTTSPPRWRTKSAPS